ncbi:MAG: hypothetical protein K1X86_07460 [Ignavibacteria bacterium]|nr:hypothetical protein [Ignavibacteria bacterium]
MKNILFIFILVSIFCKCYATTDTILEKVSIKYPVADAVVNTDNLFIITWEYSGTDDKKVCISLTTDDNSWYVLKNDVSLKSQYLNVKLDPKKVNSSKNCKVKFELDFEKFITSEKFEIVSSNDLSSPYYVSTGLNFNYASDLKVNGVYFSITTSLDKVLYDGAHLDLLLAQGKTQTEVTSQTKVDNITKTYKTKTDNYNIYAVGSFKHKIPFLKRIDVILPQFELRTVQKKINDIQTEKPDGGNETTTKDVNNDSVIFDHLLGTGIGYTFKEKELMKLDIDFILGYTFRGTDRFAQIVRFNLKTLKGFNIGGEIRNPIKGVDNDPSRQSEILIYISKDIDIDALSKLIKD